MGEFVKYFGDLTLAQVIGLIVALSFLYGVIRQGVILICTMHDKQQEKDAKLAEVDKLVDQLDKVSDGVLALLHYRLYMECERHIITGYISKDDLSDIGHLYDSYHALGGNGTGTQLYTQASALPIRGKNLVHRKD